MEPVISPTLSSRNHHVFNVFSGITPLAYVPPSLPVKQSEWPTLGEMIDSGKRVVVFLDAGADNSGVDFILPEFAMVRLHAFCVILTSELAFRSGKHHSVSPTPASLVRLIVSMDHSRQKTTLT